MRRKRLQHAADILCKKFCGWRLHSTKPSLVQLGTGTIEIDVLTGNCLFEGKSIESLPIARELHGWLGDDLKSHHIAIEELKVARLSARLAFGLIPWSERRKKTEIFCRDGHSVRTEQVHHCESEIATDEGLYRSRLEDFQEWPTEWP